MNLKPALSEIATYAKGLGIVAIALDPDNYVLTQVLLLGKRTMLDVQNLKWMDSKLDYVAIKHMPTNRLRNIILHIEQKGYSKESEYCYTKTEDWLRILKLEVKVRQMKAIRDKVLIEFAKLSLDMYQMESETSEFCNHDEDCPHALLQEQFERVKSHIESVY